MMGSPNVFLYLRKSRDKAELADPDLLYKHRREGLRWAAGRGLTVPPDHIFEEKGSGQRLRSRPDCRRMLDLVSRLPRRAGGFLWTTEVSRLTRGSLSDRATIYEILSTRSVVHVTRAGDFDLNNAHQLHFWESQTEAASYELGVFKERVEQARVEMALEGRILTGKPPFGWWWDRNAKNADGSRGRVQVDPVRFPVVVALCQDALSLSTYRLAEKYGLKQGMIHDLLRNPFLCGHPARRHYPHGGERVRRDNGEPWKYGSHKVAPEDWLRAETPGDYEPACTVEHWEAIQAVLDERRLTRCQTGEANAWCRSVVRFLGHEGHARLSAKNSGRYSIPTYELSAPRGRTQIYVPRQKVHDAADAAMTELLSDTAWLKDKVEEYRKLRVEPDEKPRDAALSDEVRALERRIDALLDRELDAAERRDSEEVASIKRQREDYKRQLAAAKAALAALQGSQAADGQIDRLIALLPALGAEGQAVWADCDDGLRAALVAGFIKTVVCRVEPVAGRRAWRREVAEVRLKERFRRGSK